MPDIDEVELDSIIQRALEQGGLTDDLKKIGSLPAFRNVVREILKENRDQALAIVGGLLDRLMNLLTLVQLNRLGVLSLEDYKEQGRMRGAWLEKKDRLVELLREAADLFDSGQCDSGPYPSIEKYGEIDDQMWCGSKKLREWAQLIQLSPVEVVFPVTRQQTGPFISRENIGNRGGAADSDAALRGLVVREIASHVPDTMDQRYATISKLAKFVGVSVDPKYVRSILQRGHT